MQVIQGRARDTDALRRQFDRWQQELGPDAKGYLGTTGGVAEDGTVIVLARFENEEAARANSERPEQGAWWAETAKSFEGEASFRDLNDVETTLAGGSDAAGFVQVMQGRVRDRDRLRALEAKYTPQMTELRPDVIGTVRGWEGDSFTEAIYFTSEADARKGESNMPEDGAEEFAEYMSLFEDVQYVDLKDPWLRSP